MTLSMSGYLDVEVRVGEPVGFDTLEEPPERRGIGHIAGSLLATAACKHSPDTATNIGDY